MSCASSVPPPRTKYSQRSHGIHMDIHKPRYTPMSRRRRIYEGKGKVLYEGPEPGTLIQHFKDDATAFGWANPQEIDDIMALAIRVNDFLSGVFLGVGIRLVDFKMETGRLWENDLMRIVVADEISTDSCRLWDIKSNEKLDKDRFRRDLGGLVEAYTEVAKRLGIMSEGERPQGTGTVLVKG